MAEAAPHPGGSLSARRRLPHGLTLRRSAYLRDHLRRLGERRRGAAQPNETGQEFEALLVERPSTPRAGAPAISGSTVPVRQSRASAATARAPAARPHRAGPSPATTPARSLSLDLPATGPPPPVRAPLAEGEHHAPAAEAAPGSTSCRSAARIIQDSVQDRRPRRRPASEHQRALGQPLGDRTRPGPRRPERPGPRPTPSRRPPVPEPHRALAAPSADTASARCAPSARTTWQRPTRSPARLAPRDHCHRHIAARNGQPGRSPHRRILGNRPPLPVSAAASRASATRKPRASAGSRQSQASAA